MFELKHHGEATAIKRRAEMSWIWPAASGLYIVFITKNNEGDFTVRYSKDREDGHAASLGEIVFPSFELAEKFSVTLVDILKAAWSSPDAKVTCTDLRGTPEF